jgi:hypothetical protein
MNRSIALVVFALVSVSSSAKAEDFKLPSEVSPQLRAASSVQRPLANGRANPSTRPVAR